MRESLRTSDPLAQEPELSQLHVERMRRAVLAAVGAPPAGSSTNVRRWAVATAVLAVMLAAGIKMGMEAPTDSTRTPVPPSALTTAVSTPRQLQFVTPGGTRVIWTFNAEFDSAGVHR